MINPTPNCLLRGLLRRGFLFPRFPLRSERLVGEPARMRSVPTLLLIDTLKTNLASERPTTIKRKPRKRSHSPTRRGAKTQTGHRNLRSDTPTQPLLIDPPRADPTFEPKFRSRRGLLRPLTIYDFPKGGGGPSIDRKPIDMKINWIMERLLSGK
jgi:hypothetical protein